MTKVQHEADREKSEFGSVLLCLFMQVTLCVITPLSTSLKKIITVFCPTCPFAT